MVFPRNKKKVLERVLVGIMKLKIKEHSNSFFPLLSASFDEGKTCGFPRRLATKTSKWTSLSLFFCRSFFLVKIKTKRNSFCFVFLFSIWKSNCIWQQELQNDVQAQRKVETPFLIPEKNEWWVKILEIFNKHYFAVFSTFFTLKSEKRTSVLMNQNTCLQFVANL